MVVVCGCGPKKGGEAPPPPPPAPDAGAPPAGELTPEKTKLAEEAVALMRDLADAAGRAAGDCERLADELAAVIDGPRGDAIIKADATLSEADMVVVSERYGQELDAHTTRFTTAAESCLQHPGVDAALRRAGFGEEE